jgi:geranylgeranyl pyrophosphate synthase
MLATQDRPVASMCDVDAELDRLLTLNPSQVTEAARYHFSAGGARTRARLGLAAAAALGLSPQASLVCALAPELLHNASLIHDDLQDGDTMRRNTSAVWSKYGKDVAISAGDLLISAAYVTVAKHPQPALALSAMHDAVSMTIYGQSQDCRTDHPTQKDYEIIAANKSGPLIALPIRLALIAADVPGQDVATRAGRALAIAYQTLDDIADRNADLESGATNICLSLEAAGLSIKAAQCCARVSAQAALQTARANANALPSGAGRPFLDLANRLEIQLKEISDAT